MESPIALTEATTRWLAPAWGGMGGVQGSKPTPGDMNDRQQMLEKRMDMMQMMMDRLPAAPAK